MTPSTGDDVDIATGDTVNYTTALYGVGTELLDLDVSGGSTLNISVDMHIGNNTGANPLSFSGATISHTAGTVDIDSSSAFSGFFVAGTYNQSGGTVASDGRVAVSSGSFNLSSGTLDNNGDILHFTGASTGLLNFTGGTLESNGGPWFGGEFAFAGSAGGLIYDVTGGSAITVGNGTSTDMTLSVQGGAAVNRIESNGVDLVIDGTDGIFEATINASGDRFLKLTEGGDVLLDGTLNVIDLTGGAPGKYDIIEVTGGGSIVGDFAAVFLPVEFVVLDNGNVDGTYTIALIQIPEPGTACLIGIGLFGLARRRRRLGGPGK